MLALLIALASSLPAAAPPPTMAEVLASAPASDWRQPDPDNTLYLELESGRVVIELAPEFAPRHVANLHTLVRAGYFDGLAIVRAQENYVVQWGDPATGGDGARALGDAQRSLKPEFDRPWDARLPFTALPDGDVYAPEVGLVRGFPAARDARVKRLWLAHCYGMVGVGRDNAPDSGSGAELYVVIGHAPRHLDRNVTLLGRVLSGMELLSVLPRGSDALGFYQQEQARPPIRALRIAADLPEGERTALEVMRTESESFKRLIEARRFRREPWFATPTGKIELCNVPIPVRSASKP
jgi:peptidylprolyl isomerase